MNDLINDAFECVGNMEDILHKVDLGSSGASIDLAAQLRLHVKAIEKIEKTITKSVTSDVVCDQPTPQGSSGRLDGINFYATVTHSIRWSFDSKAVRVEMGDAWYDARCKQSEVRSVKYGELS